MKCVTIVKLSIENLHPIFQNFVEAYDSAAKTRDFDPIRADYMIFMEEWRHHYTRFKPGLSAELLISYCKEIIPLFEEFLPKFENFQKKHLEKRNADTAATLVAAVHTNLIGSVKQQLKNLTEFLSGDELLKRHGFSYTFATVLHQVP